MKKAENILKRIRLISFNANIKQLDINSEQYNLRMNAFSKKILDSISSESIDTIVFCLNGIYLVNPELIYYILQQNNEKIIASWIVLEYIRGSYIENNSKTISRPFFMNNGESKEKIIADSKIETFLENYIKKNNLDESYFFTDEWQQFFISLFTKYKNDLLNNEYIVNIDNLLNSFLPSNLILDDKKRQIVSILEDETKGFEFDYYTFCDLFPRVKGFYKFFPIEDQLHYIILRSYHSDYYIQEMKKMFDMFQKIAEINSDDEKGLREFFRRVEYCLSCNEYFYNLFKETEIFKKYLIHNYEEASHEAVQKLLNKDDNIDESLLYCLGSSKEFLDNYDFFLDQFMTSDDDNYKRKLFIPLLMGLFEKLKNKYRVQHYKLCYSVPSKIAGGECNYKLALIKIDLGIMNQSANINDAFIKLVGILFHEMRHAYQYEHLIKHGSIEDFDNLVIAMDEVLKYLDPNFIESNYFLLGIEQDAAACEYVDTMNYFSKYPELQKRVLALTQESVYENKDRSQSFYIRAKKDNNGVIRNYGLIDLFLKEVNGDFLEGEERKRRREESSKLLEKYPILGYYFETDRENHTTKLISMEVLLEWFENNLQYDLDLHGMKLFRHLILSLKHALDVSKYLENPENAIEHINDAVGLPPIVEKEERELMGKRR